MDSKLFLAPHFASLTLNPGEKSPLQSFESLCQTLYASTDPQSRQHANQVLCAMKKPENLQSMRYFIDASSQMHAQFLAASCLKDVFVECWP